jgi:VanZ like protein
LRGPHRVRLATAIATSAAVIASGPFIGDIRSAILAAFPSQFQLIIGATVAAAVAVALIVAVVSIRDRRRWRFTGLLVAIGGGVVYARLVATGNLLVDVVEHVHFVEYGLVAWLFYRAWRPLDTGAAIIWPLLAGILVGIVDESVQAFIPSRVGEAHDIFLNAVAVGCGLCFAVSVDPPDHLGIPLERSVVRPLAYGVSVVLLAFAAFFQAVHLGHELYAPGIGMFWSHYDAPTLAAMSADRADRWRTDPPTQPRRLSREDEYLSEALWHVQERNRAWGAGDPFTAWRENLILERFYAPVLDTSTFASPVPPRWPAPQRDETAARVASDPGIYVSRAAPYPIYAWSPLVFWAGVALVVAGVISAC